MIFRRLIQNLWSHWEWAEKKGREAVDMSSNAILPHWPDRFSTHCLMNQTGGSLHLLRQKLSSRWGTWRFSGQKSETIIKRGSNRAQPSPTSKSRAWGRLHWRASLGRVTAACTIISIRITAVVTSATAPKLSRFETCADKPNSIEERFKKDLGEESGGN